MEPGLFLILAQTCGPTCDPWFDALLALAATGSLFLVTVFGFWVSFERLRGFRRIRRLSTEPIGTVLTGPFDRLVELRGQAKRATAERMLLTDTMAAAGRRTITVTWARSVFWKDRFRFLRHEESFLNQIVLDDGTGQVLVDASDAHRYWLSKVANWKIEEAPDWARQRYEELRQRHGDTIASWEDSRFSARSIEVWEEYLPIGSELFVTGRLQPISENGNTASGARGLATVRAEVASLGRESSTGYGLLVEGILAFLAAAGAAVGISRLTPWLVGTLVRYLADQQSWWDRVVQGGIMLVISAVAWWLTLLVTFGTIGVFGEMITLRGRKSA
jgi:hypothetical protein